MGQTHSTSSDSEGSIASELFSIQLLDRHRTKNTLFFNNSSKNIDSLSVFLA